MVLFEVAEGRSAMSYDELGRLRPMMRDFLAHSLTRSLTLDLRRVSCDHWSVGDCAGKEEVRTVEVGEARLAEKS